MQSVIVSTVARTGPADLHRSDYLSLALLVAPSCPPLLRCQREKEWSKSGIILKRRPSSPVLAVSREQQLQLFVLSAESCFISLHIYWDTERMFDNFIVPALQRSVVGCLMCEWEAGRCGQPTPSSIVHLAAAAQQWSYRRAQLKLFWQGAQQF